MLRKSAAFACLAMISILLVACGDPVTDALGKMEAAANKVKQAVATNNQDEFVAGMGDMANAMRKLKPAVQGVTADQRPEYLKQAQKSMVAWQQVSSSPEFVKLAGEVMAGPNAPKLSEIMQQMATLMAADGNQV